MHHREKVLELCELSLRKGEPIPKPLIDAAMRLGINVPNGTSLNQSKKKENDSGTKS